MAVASIAWSGILLAVLFITGASVVLRDMAEYLSAALVPDVAARSVSVVFYLCVLILLNEAGTLPIAAYGFALENRYGLSRQPFRGWLRDQGKSLALSAILASLAGCLLYALIDRYLALWWLPAAAVFALLIIGLANIAPLLLLPLFYTVRPLTRESLRERLVRLAEKAGARVLDAYEWGLGEKSNRANAALTGIGRSRRILVSDTMLASYTDDEIEVVLAHELAHHVHGDIWKGIALEVVLIAAGFFAGARLLAWSAPLVGLRGASDLAGLPLLLLAAGAVSLVMVPAAHAMSRAHERSADRFALNLTGNPAAFVSAMRRLGAQNMAEDEPSAVVQWLFHSHPPIRERIAAAEAFKR